MPSFTIEVLSADHPNADFHYYYDFFVTKHTDEDWPPYRDMLRTCLRQVISNAQMNKLIGVHKADIARYHTHWNENERIYTYYRSDLYEHTD